MANLPFFDYNEQSDREWDSWGERGPNVTAAMQKVTAYCDDPTLRIDTDCDIIFTPLDTVFNGAIMTSSYKARFRRIDSSCHRYFEAWLPQGAKILCRILHRNLPVYQFQFTVTTDPTYDLSLYLSPPS